MTHEPQPPITLANFESRQARTGQRPSEHERVDKSQLLQGTQTPCRLVYSDSRRHKQPCSRSGRGPRQGVHSIVPMHHDTREVPYPAACVSPISRHGEVRQGGRLNQGEPEVRTRAHAGEMRAELPCSDDILFDSGQVVDTLGLDYRTRIEASDNARVACPGAQQFRSTGGTP